MSESVRVEMLKQRREETFACLLLHLAAASTRADPRLHEGRDQPRPGRSLVIRGIAGCGPAAVAPDISRFVHGKRAEAQRSPQTRFDGVERAKHLVTIDEDDREAAKREDLIRPE